MVAISVTSFTESFNTSDILYCTKTNKKREKYSNGDYYSRTVPWSNGYNQRLAFGEKYFSSPDDA